MRLVALITLLACRPCRSFQIGSTPPSCRRAAFRCGFSRYIATGYSSSRSSGRISGIVMNGKLDARPLPLLDGPRPNSIRVSSSSHSKANTGAWPPLEALKGAAIAVFAAAVLVLGVDPATALADSVSSPSGTPQAITTANMIDSTDSISPTPSEEVVPTIKLEGELATQFQKAQSAGSVQQFDKAKKLYNQVVKYAPGYVYGWSNRANVLIAEGDLKGAVRDYDRALELAKGLAMPDKWIIHLNRGTTLMALGEDNLAMSDFNQAVKLNNAKDLLTLANRAQAYERKGDWAKALADYEGAISVQPGNVQPWWIRYSLVLFQEGRDFDSLAFLKRVQAKFEGVGEVQAAMTAIQFGRGDIKEATRAWRGINMVDQQVYLEDVYLKDKLRWPPRMVESLKAFDREAHKADARLMDPRPPPTAAPATVAS